MVTNLHEIFTSCSWRNTYSKCFNKMWLLISVSSILWQNFMLLDKGGPHEREGERRAPPLKGVILALLPHLTWKWLKIGTNMLLILTSTGEYLLRNVNIDDLEWPWTLKIGGFIDFFAISGCDKHFKSELRRNGWRETKIVFMQNF